MASIAGVNLWKAEISGKLRWPQAPAGGIRTGGQAPEQRLLLSLKALNSSMRIKRSSVGETAGGASSITPVRDIIRKGGAIAAIL